MGEGPAGDPVIVFNCPSCGQTIRVPRELAGKRGKCNQCGTTVRVPAGRADTPFQPFAELEGSVRFQEADAPASGPVSPTPVANQEPDEEADEVPPEEIVLDPDPPEPEDAIEDLAKVTTANKPTRKTARGSPWPVGAVVALLLAGLIVLGVAYRISHRNSFPQAQKIQREPAGENDNSRNASPAKPVVSLPPEDKADLEAKLSEAMAKAEKIANSGRDEPLSEASCKELNSEIDEILRLRGDLDLPNSLIRDPDFGAEYSGPLASWNELQMILHPEKHPGCQVRVVKIKAPG